jgi:uncharacterized protein
MYCKKHVFGTKIVIALCDKELIGKKLTEDKVIIDLDKFRYFYIGDDFNYLDERFDSINAIGKKSIDFLVKNNYLKDKKNVRKIEKIPHIQIFKY